MSGGLAKVFLDDIVANIDDDTPRLVYADWLMEDGQDDRAEFIRVQIERSRLPAWDAAQVRLGLREQELLKRHGEGWLAEVPAVEGAKWEGFRRGIVAEVSFASFEAMRSNAHACRAVAPVEAVTVRWPRRREPKKAGTPIAELRELSLTGMPNGDDEVARLADSPQLATLRILTARGLWAESLGWLVDSPHLAGLKVLRLPSNNLGNEGLRVLTGSAVLAALEELDISALGRHERYNYDPIIRAAGMGALMGWAGLARVRSLNLTGNDVSKTGLRALLRSPHAAALKALSLRDGRLNGPAMAEFLNAVPGMRLEALDLGENVLKEDGAALLASAPCLADLKSLRLDRCEIPLAGARSLAKASFVAGLRVLDVGHNSFGPAGLTAVLDAGPASLHTLRMRYNDLFDKGAALLADSPAVGELLEADLSQNDIGPPGVQSLAASAHLRELRVLRLGDNPIPEAAAVALATSPLGKRLSVLDMEQLPPPPEVPDWVEQGDLPDDGEENIPF